MTPEVAIVGAMLAQAGLALALMYRLGALRVPLVTKGEIKFKDIALESDNWPEDARKTGNALNNQFQLPVIFYLAAGLTLYLGSSWLEAGLACAFVVTRFAHAFIHITTNHVPTRFQFFTLGFGILCVLWAVVLVRWAVWAFGG